MSDTKLSAGSMEPIDITPLTEENFSFFQPMLPNEMCRLFKSGEVLAMGAVVDGAACGVIVVEPKNAEQNYAQLLWIYVAEDNRREYIGSTLFCEMAEFLQEFDENDIGEVAGIICRYTVSGDGEESELQGFLKAMKFDGEETGEYSVTLTLGELHELGFSEEPSPADSITYAPVIKLSPYHLHKLNTALDAQSANYSGGPVSFDSVLPYCSTVMYRSNNPTGCICISEGDTDEDADGNPMKEKILTVLFIGEKDTKAINGMLRKASSALIEKNSPDTMLKIPIVSDSAGRMAKFMLKDKESVCEKVFFARHTF